MGGGASGRTRHAGTGPRQLAAEATRQRQSSTLDFEILGGTHGPSPFVDFGTEIRTQGAHGRCGAHAWGLGAEGMGMTNTRRKKKAKSS